MFKSTVRSELRPVIREIVGQYPGLPAYVGGSGNLTVERVLADAGVREMRGCDVALYPCVIGHLAGGWGVSESNKRRSRVPLASVFGGDTVPVDVARTLKRAVDKMVARKEVEPEEAWRCLEQWATKYLEGE